MDSSVTHDMESRLRNIEAHLGIGKTDEETGAYSVKEPEEAGVKEAETEPEHEEGV